MSIRSVWGCWNTDKKDEDGPVGGWPRCGISRRRRWPIWGKFQIRVLWWLIGSEERCIGFVMRLRSRPHTQFIAIARVFHEFGMRWARGRRGGESPQHNYHGVHRGKGSGGIWAIYYDLLRHGNASKYVVPLRQAANFGDGISTGRGASGYGGQLTISSVVKIFSLVR
jgi:hypothetical protein